MVGKMFGLSDDRATQLRVAFGLQLREAAASASENFDELFDHLARNFLLDTFARAGADEGTVWLLDAGRKELVPVYNSGPRAKEFVGTFKQSLRSGMISMVVATEQPICENEVYKNERQDKEVDRKLGLRTCAMIAVPLVFSGELRGVISCVQVRPGNSADPDPPGFTQENLLEILLASSLLGRLLEGRLLAHCLGFTPIS